jgi:hypothetical protein
MSERGNVVPETIGIREDQFHGAMVAGLGRAERRVGEKALAFIMDVTRKQLKNIFGGSAPHPKRLWDALSADPSALDDIAVLYGKRIVDKEATDAATENVDPEPLVEGRANDLHGDPVALAQLLDDLRCRDLDRQQLLPRVGIENVEALRSAQQAGFDQVHDQRQRSRAILAPAPRERDVIVRTPIGRHPARADARA